VLDKSTRNPPSIYEPPVGPVSNDRPLEPTQPQLSKTLPGAVAGLRSIFNNATAERRLVSSKPEPVVEAVATHLSRGGTVRFTATTAAEIRGALDLTNRFSLSSIISDCSGLKSIKDFTPWQRRIHGVVLPGLSPGKISNPAADSLGEQESPWDYVRPIIDAGIPVAIRPEDDADLGKLMFVAGQFLQGDVTRSEVLSMLTRWPAKMMGVDDRVGSLAIGKDADFVVLTNDPFMLRTAITATYVGGNNVFRVEPETATTVIRAAQIYTGNGNVVSDGTLVVKGKSLRGIGANVSAPLNSQVKDFGDAVIVPGFVDLGTSLGIGGALNGNVSLQTKLGDALYEDDPAIELARNSGVTTVLLGSLNTDGPTPMVAFKLGDDMRVLADPAAIRFRIGNSPATSVAAITRSLDRGKAYVDSWAKYEADLVAYEAAKAARKEEVAKEDKKESDNEKESGKKEAEEAQKDSDKKEEADKKNESDRPGAGRGGEGNGSRRRGSRTREGAKPRPPRNESSDDKKQEADKEPADKKQGEEKDQVDDAEKAESKEDEDAPEKPELKEDLEPYRALFAGEIPAFVEARRGNAIKAAIELFCEKYALRMVLVGGDDLARMPNLLQGHDVSVCAGPDLFVKIDAEKINLPQLLANEQIPFGFHSKSRTGVSQLPRAIQFSVAEGLGLNDGLQALTDGPAKMLSGKLQIGKLQIGSLKTGMDADLVVLSGPPFEHSSKVIAVMIDGNWVYEREDN